MRKLSTFTIIIACLFITYYFAVFQPKFQIQKIHAEAYAADESNKADLEMQDKCATMSEEVFKQLFESNNATYKYHYNKGMKKCFMTVLSKDVRDKEFYTAKYLIDVFENKILGEYYFKTEEGKTSSEVKPLYCNMLDKISDATQEEYDAFVEPYMEN